MSALVDLLRELPAEQHALVALALGDVLEDLAAGRLVIEDIAQGVMTMAVARARVAVLVTEQVPVAGTVEQV